MLNREFVIKGLAYKNLSDLLSNLSSILNITNRENQTRGLFAVFFASLIGATVEVGGISASFPFVYSIINVEELKVSEIWGRIVTMFALKTDSDIRWFFGLIFVALISISNLLRIVVLIIQNKLLANISARLSNALFERIIRQPLKSQLEMTSSKVLGNLTHDVNASIGVLNNLLNFVAYSLIIISLYAVLSYVNPMFTFISTLCIGAVFCFFGITTGMRLRRNSENISEGYYQSIKVIQDSMAMIRQIKIEQKEKYFSDLHFVSDKRHKLAASRNTVISAVPRYIIEIGAVFSICFGTILALDFGVGTSTILPFLGLIAVTVARIFPLAQQIYASYSTSLGATRLLHVPKFPSSISTPSTAS